MFWNELVTHIQILQCFLTLSYAQVVWLFKIILKIKVSEFPSWMDACLEELLPVRVLEVLFQMHRMTFRYSADENTHISSWTFVRTLLCLWNVCSAQRNSCGISEVVCEPRTLPLGIYGVVSTVYLGGFKNLTSWYWLCCPFYFKRNFSYLLCFWVSCVLKNDINGFILHVRRAARWQCFFYVFCRKWGV